MSKGNKKKTKAKPTSDKDRGAKPTGDESKKDKKDKKDKSAKPAKPTADESKKDKGARQAKSDESTVAESKASAPGFVARNDLGVLLIAALLIAAGSYLYRGMSTPGTTELHLHGLSLVRPVGFLPPTPVPQATTALAMAMTTPQPTADAGPAEDAGPEGDDEEEPESAGALDAGPPALPDELLPPTTTDKRHHVVYQAPTDPRLRLEVQIGPQPLYNNLIGALSIDRSGRYGETYWAADSSITNIGGRDWTRTEFSYAYKAGFNASPRIAHAIEYASVNSGSVYVVTFHGSSEQARELAALVAPTLTLRAAQLPSQPE